jgi:hypothetical protein
MSMAEVFLDIEKAFDTTCHTGLLYKLPKLKFLTSLFNLISSFLSKERKFRLLVGEMSVPRGVQTGMP